MKHTPRPWKVATTGEYEICISMVRKSDTYSGIAWVQRAGRDPGEPEANARLIAAAPELLEACRNALEYLECQPTGTTASLVKGHLRKAIDEATGENDIEGK